MKKENGELQTTGVHFYVHYMLRVAFQFRACLCVSECALGGEKRASDSLEVKLQVVVAHPVTGGN